MVHIVGAGPGAPDLITVRGLKLLERADIVIYAGSLVNDQLLDACRTDCRIYDSSGMTLEEVLEVMIQAEAAGEMTVRLHTGDPCLYGAIREQMDQMEVNGIAYEICPGVSSFCGAAAALEMEYTLPGISQSVVITRMAGRTPVPELESIASFAAHQATMVVFLSTGLLAALTGELIRGGYKTETPAAIVYKATWEDEKVMVCTVETLVETARQSGITKTALIIVGEAVRHGGKHPSHSFHGMYGYERSRLYDPVFTTGYRTGTGEEGPSPVRLTEGEENPPHVRSAGWEKPV